MSMEFVTARLVLRPLTAKDEDSLFELDSDPEVMRLAEWRPGHAFRADS